MFETREQQRRRLLQMVSDLRAMTDRFVGMQMCKRTVWELQRALSAIVQNATRGYSAWPERIKLDVDEALGSIVVRFEPAFEELLRELLDGQDQVAVSLAKRGGDGA